MNASTARRDRQALQARLEARRAEIEEAILCRVQAVSEPSAAVDPEYAAGLRTAVSAAIDYGIAGILSSGGEAPPVPAQLLVQARLAARNGIGLDTVLRRYVAGYTLLGHFLIEECETAGLLQGAELKRLLRTQAAVLDGLLAAIGEEHARDGQKGPSGVERRRAELVERLLAGEPLDDAALGYELVASHCALIASGLGCGEALAELARDLDRRLLLVQRESEVAWAWLGGARRFDADEMEQLVDFVPPPGVVLAIGEPGKGPACWRLSHQQARAAMQVAIERRRHTARYGDFALLASIMQDDLLEESLRRLYLAPLSADGDGGDVLRDTLRAYFATGSNISSAAARLGINRHTVTKRLRMVEDRVGRSLNSCALELNAALLLEDRA